MYSSAVHKKLSNQKEGYIQECCLKKSDRPHHDMFCVAKTTNQPPSQPPYSAVGKAPGFKTQGRGLDPGSDHLFFSDFYFYF